MLAPLFIIVILSLFVLSFMMFSLSPSSCCQAYIILYLSLYSKLAVCQWWTLAVNPYRDHKEHDRFSQSFMIVQIFHTINFSGEDSLNIFNFIYDLLSFW